jgi:chaperonin GroES
MEGRKAELLHRIESDRPSPNRAALKRFPGHSYGPNLALLCSRSFVVEGADIALYPVANHSRSGPTAHSRCSRLREDPVKFRPLQDRVLIRRTEEEEKTAGGIIIPDTAKEKPMEGEVIAAGPGTRGDDGKLQPLDVKVGDRVLFGKWSGTEIKIDGEDFVVAKESDIMGVVEETASRRVG